MGSLKQVTHIVKYKVPSSPYCNLMNPFTLEDTAEKCRFCAGNNRVGYTCLMHNMPLGMADRNLVVKTPECACPARSRWNKMTVVDVPDQALSNNKPMVDPKQIMKLTIEDFIKVTKQLEDQGFPSAMAQKLAKELVLKGAK